ncbi:hypothetical protein L5515_007059 [Caenorhabditis briggsae]|uniref:Uncharacterized protein n=1 Tax=Caenorhabditis briggsae TaxID=6238 RepID=A0AAE9EXF3_CAEBR|nr:hypothetical protein L5515_007059 [Caenorhabditis briggsae]
MPGRFDGKVVIVTGSSSGIGKETALHFAREGAKVTVTGRSLERLQAVKKELLGNGVLEKDFLIVPADVTSSAGQDELISQTLSKFGKIDVLINNAGASITDFEGKTGVSQGIDSYEKTMKLNVQSLVEMTQKARPHLAKTRGEIVNVSSIVALGHGWQSRPYYSLAKAAVDQYTRAAAIDLIEEGIRVNTVNPGFVKTLFHEAELGWTADQAQEFYDDIGSNKYAIPAGFIGRPEHIAKAIAFLADRNSSEFIVGQNLVVDGGTTLVLGIHAAK